MYRNRSSYCVLEKAYMQHAFWCLLHVLAVRSLRSAYSCTTKGTWLQWKGAIMRNTKHLEPYSKWHEHFQNHAICKDACWITCWWTADGYTVKPHYYNFEGTAIKEHIIQENMRVLYDSKLCTHLRASNILQDQVLVLGAWRIGFTYPWTKNFENGLLQCPHE